ncbi:hypothetical protein Goshw_015653, partial [Gossypium schwendimanii]|nr:hypothetical protein [Gossypium schwendimanii]
MRGQCFSFVRFPKFVKGRRAIAKLNGYVVFGSQVFTRMARFNRKSSFWRKFKSQEKGYNQGQRVNKVKNDRSKKGTKKEQTQMENTETEKNGNAFKKSEDFDQKKPFSELQVRSIKEYHSDDDRSKMMRMRIGHLRPDLLCITDMVCLLEVFLAIDIGILRIRLNDQWLTIALMGGFARMDNNEITILVNEAEKGSDIDPQEAQQALEIAEANL